MSFSRLLMILGSLIPLGLLTAWSVSEAVQGSPVSVSSSGAPLSGAPPVPADIAALDLENDAQTVSWFSDVVARPYDKWPAAPAVKDPRWKEVVEQDQRRLELAQELAKEFSDGLKATKGAEANPNEATLDAAAKRLTDLRKSLDRKAADVRQVEALQRLVDQRVAKVEETIQTSKVTATNRDVLKRAQLAFRNSQYDQCLKILQEWLGPRNAELDVLEVAARYHKEADQLRLRIGQAVTPVQGKSFPEPTPAWDPLVRDLEAFFTKYPEAPGGASATLDDEVRRGLKSLKLLIAIQSVPRVPPRNVGQMVAVLKRILAQGPDDPVKENLAAAMKAWVERSLPVKDVPVKEYQFAVDTQANTLLEGEFLAAPGGDSWRYWPPSKPSKQFPNAYLPYPKARLTTPADPTDKAASKDYLMQRNKLLAAVGDLASWQSFARRCDSYEAKMADYVKLGGKVEVSFTSEGQFAKDIVAAWEELAPLFNR
ncbi:MAG: hypothetical protein U0935_16520 [Pirellulales bacterium]